MCNTYTSYANPAKCYNIVYVYDCHWCGAAAVVTAHRRTVATSDDDITIPVWTAQAVTCDARYPEQGDHGHHEMDVGHPVHAGPDPDQLVPIHAAPGAVQPAGRGEHRSCAAQRVLDRCSVAPGDLLDKLLAGFVVMLRVSAVTGGGMVLSCSPAEVSIGVALLAIFVYDLAEIAGNDKIHDSPGKIVQSKHDSVAMPAEEGIKAFDYRGVPYFFGVCCYCFEGIGMVLPVYNSMAQPDRFKAACGACSRIVTQSVYSFRQNRAPSIALQSRGARLPRSTPCAGRCRRQTGLSRVSGHLGVGLRYRGHPLRHLRGATIYEYGRVPRRRVSEHDFRGPTDRVRNETPVPLYSSSDLPCTETPKRTGDPIHNAGTGWGRAGGTERGVYVFRYRCGFSCLLCMCACVRVHV